MGVPHKKRKPNYGSAMSRQYAQGIINNKIRNQNGGDIPSELSELEKKYLKATEDLMGSMPDKFKDISQASYWRKMYEAEVDKHPETRYMAPQKQKKKEKAEQAEPVKKKKEKKRILRKILMRED